MTQTDVLELFLTYLVLLAPLIIGYLFVSVIMSWLKKLFEVISGKGW